LNAPGDVKAWLAEQERRELLRLITCGSVDDGKSTLIGRLLYETRQVFDDQLAVLETDSKRHGTQGEALDFALLVDGLSAEREQGITIDVAYRYFSSEKRKYIVADAPGHEQYTRNMVTGASTAELALLLVDARKGVLTQTRRHSYLAHLLGIRRFVLAVNKMDLVDFDRQAFDAIAAEYRAFADRDHRVGRGSSVGDGRRQCDQPKRRDGLVRWTDPARSPGLGSARPCRGCRQAAANAGSVGEPPESGFPRLRRADRRRQGRAGR
jgi:translation elongation factor EF-Tu-like GTPase